MTRQQTIDDAVSLAIAMANDPRYGYDQGNRWGPDYDCSSFIVTVWQDVGVPVRTAGASWTGNMYDAFIKCGFRDVTKNVNLSNAAGMQPGDVLLNKKNHVEMYIGDHRNVKASINENGGIKGGKTGDQTGREIYISNYYNYPWDAVLRYEGAGSDEPEPEDPVPDSQEDPDDGFCSVKLPVLQIGDCNGYVSALQALLIARGCSVGPDGADGDFGNNTRLALIAFQRRKDLDQDGVAGPITWDALLRG
jgi:hypothetical protein